MKTLPSCYESPKNDGKHTDKNAQRVPFPVDKIRQFTFSLVEEEIKCLSD